MAKTTGKRTPKPCNKCGRKPSLWKAEGHEPFTYSYQCTNCRRITTSWPTVKEAREEWNKDYAD